MAADVPRVDRPWVVVVAGGSGARYGGLKQFATVAGRPVTGWSVAAARSLGGGVVLVVPAGTESGVQHSSGGDPPDDTDRGASIRTEGDAPLGADLVVGGGASRSASVRAGLAMVPADVDVVVVHDAARPAASPDLFATVVAAVEAGADAAVPGVAVVDSLRRRDGGAIDRDTLVAVQTPQAFRATALREAHLGGDDASDDATLVERAGGRVVVVPGETTNVKLTRPADLALLEATLCPTALHPTTGAR